MTAALPHLKVWITCSLCYTEFEPEISRDEAFEDALAIGWEMRNGHMVCVDCIIEEEML